MSKLYNVFRGHSGTIWTIGINDNNSFVFSGGDSGMLQIWDFAEPPIDEESTDEFVTSVQAILVTDDGLNALVIHQDGVIRIWDIENCSLVSKIEENIKEGIPIELLGKYYLTFTDTYHKSTGYYNGSIHENEYGNLNKYHQTWLTKYTLTYKDSGLLVSRWYKERYIGEDRWNVRTKADFPATFDFGEMPLGRQDKAPCVSTLNSNEYFAAIQGNSLFILKLSSVGEIKYGYREEFYEAVTSITTDKILTCCAANPDGTLVVTGDEIGQVAFFQLKR